MEVSESSCDALRLAVASRCAGLGSFDGWND